MRGPKLRRRVASPTSFERVPPLDPGKAEKIRFGRVNDAPGFYGKRGQVSVGGQVSTFPFGTQKANSAWRGPGLTIVTIRRPSHDSTCEAASSIGMGLANTRGLVHRRTKPRATTHEIPTVVLPDKHEAHHFEALACEGDVES